MSTKYRDIVLESPNKVMESQVEVTSNSTTTVFQWKVRKNMIVTPKTVVCILARPDGSQESVYATDFGRIKVINKPAGSTVSINNCLCSIVVCCHEIVMKDLCALCGANLRKEDGRPGERITDTTAKIAMVHNIPELHVSEQKAQELALEDETHLLREKKLVLLVDLDQTLLHTTCLDVPSDLEDVHHFRLSGNGPLWYHTKMRPHITSFLNRISSLYELHIFTFGNRIYAHTIAGLLDPDKRFFSHRILSRDEAFDPLAKTGNLKSLFPRGDSMVCIIDDRDEVWSCAPNLIHVKPYRYFPDTGDINAPTPEAVVSLSKSKPEQSTTCEAAEGVVSPNPDSNATEGTDLEPKDGETTSDEVNMKKEDPEKEIKTKKNGSSTARNSLYPPDEDDYLLRLETLLIRIHTAFYESPPHLLKSQDLRKILPRLQNQVLAGCRLVLSGLVPLTRDASRSKAYRLAHLLGAELQSELELSKDSAQRWTTHVVACSRGTLKVKQASQYSKPSKSGSDRPLVHIVSPEWLRDCYFMWTRLPESDYPLVNDIDPSLLGFGDPVVGVGAPGGGKKRPREKNDEIGEGKKICRDVVKPKFDQSNPSLVEEADDFDAKDMAPTEAKPEEEDSNQLQAKVNSLLPKRLPLELAENPLMHLTVEDTDKMIEEIDDEISDIDSTSSSSTGDSNYQKTGEEEGSSKACKMGSGQHQKLPSSPFDEHSSSSGESMTGDYPKGWSPRRTAGTRMGSNEDDDAREYGTCPEGYDYLDAEETRRALCSSSSDNDDDGSNALDSDDCAEEEGDYDALKAFI